MEGCKTHCRGGTAEVYLLQQADPQKRAVLKLLLPDLQADSDAQKNFLREADLLEDLEELQSPSFPRMIMQASVLERTALIMDYFPGTNLMTILHHRVQIPQFPTFTAACKIIAQLHAIQIAHNDIKLANFILSPKGSLHCVDFANARRLSLSSTFFRRFRKKEPLQGTLSYLAPELIEGKSPSKASDVWALGVMAHYLFVGSPPLLGDDAATTLKQLRNETMPSLASRCPEVDQQLSKIIDRCLLADTSLRYESAEELLHLLRRYRDSRPGAQARSSAS